MVILLTQSFVDITPLEMLPRRDRSIAKHRDEFWFDHAAENI